MFAFHTAAMHIFTTVMGWQEGIKNTKDYIIHEDSSFTRVPQNHMAFSYKKVLLDIKLTITLPYSCSIKMIKQPRHIKLSSYPTDATSIKSKLTYSSSALHKLRQSELLCRRLTSTVPPVWYLSGCRTLLLTRKFGSRPTGGSSLTPAKLLPHCKQHYTETVKQHLLTQHTPRFYP